MDAQSSRLYNTLVQISFREDCISTLLIEYHQSNDVIIFHSRYQKECQVPLIISDLMCNHQHRYFKNRLHSNGIQYEFLYAASNPISYFNIKACILSDFTH